MARQLATLTQSNEVLIRSLTLRADLLQMQGDERARNDEAEMALLEHSCSDKHP